MVNVLPRNPLASLGTPVANDRLKGSFSAWFWGSVAAAALMHFLILAFWPRFSVAVSVSSDPPSNLIDVIGLPTLPPPPPAIPRPRIPIASPNVSVSPMVPTVEDSWAASPVIEPPALPGTTRTDDPPFTPFEVRPEMKNVEEFRRALLRNYPAALRNAGVGGAVLLWVHIDGSGNVTETRIRESSGSTELDQAARRAVEVARFSPALNRDQRVSVWVQIPVSFQVRE